MGVNRHRKQPREVHVHSGAPNILAHAIRAILVVRYGAR